MNDDSDQDSMEDANCLIEVPVGYFDDIDWDLVSTTVSDLIVRKLTIDEAVEVAALFDDRRIHYDDKRLTLTIYGVPAGTWQWFEPWFKHAKGEAD